MATSTPILHVDMDAFYASVEERDDPRLAGRPIAVGGSADGRGVISSASYAARKFGVRSAMPTRTAQALCRELVVVPPDFDKYIADSRKIMSIFMRYTPIVEPLSLDEAFLDVAASERVFGPPLEIARAIKRDILRETRLIASIGVASSKFIAKLASDLCKPDGLRVIEPQEVRSVLDPLPVSAIFGVGPRTAKRLESMGVRTIADLATRPRDEVLERFGASGAWIYDLAHGIDVRRVNPRREEKSFSQERTFATDETDREMLKKRLFEFSEELAFRLRSHGLRSRTVSIKARYWNFKTITRTKTLDTSTNLGVRIYSAARELFDRVPMGPLRLIGVQVSALEDVRTPAQGQLFQNGSLFPIDKPEPNVADQRRERAAASLDRLRAKFGPGTVVPATLVAPPNSQSSHVS